MIDTHCHIDASAFESDRSEVIEAAFAGGIEAIVVPAIEPKRFEGVLDVAHSDARIYCGMGVHPHHAAEIDDADLARVEELCSHDKTIAVGEIGLDYYYDFAPKDTQKAVFREQLQLAKRLNLPVIIHNRESDDDMYAILENEQDGTLQGVMHCFSGTPQQLEQALKLNLKVSFTGNVTFNKTVPQLIPLLPSDSFMLETDAPYMTPKPFRGKRNQPLFVRYVAERIAELQSTTTEEIIAMTTQTATKLFRLTLAVAFVSFLSVFSVWAAPIDDAHNAKREALSTDMHYQDDDDEYYEDDLEHPFPKTFGIAPIIGSNTIILSDQGRNPSLDGLLAFGAGMTFHFTDHLFVGLSYAHSVDRSLVNIGRASDPSVFQMIDASFSYTPNPYNKINFYFSLGGSMFFNSLSGETEQTRTGLNGGIGLVLNIETPYGLFAPTIEWRYSAVLGERLVRALPDDDDLANIGFQASMPKLMLFFYPFF